LALVTTQAAVRPPGTARAIWRPAAAVQAAAGLFTVY
jgi:hypothetical protein